jgi:hypothetical protein
MELAEGSSQTQLRARGRKGALGEDTDALVSLQRQAALTGLAAGGVAGWDALLALSLTKARFTGIDSMKLDREEEDMVAVFFRKLLKIIYGLIERCNSRFWRFH